MTKLTQTRLALSAAALGIAVLGAAAIAGETDGTDRLIHAQTATAPVACVLSADTSGRGLVLEGIVQAHEAVSGIYQLRIEGPGTRMNQGGPFSLSAGQTVQLGQMTTSGSGAGLEAELTLTVDGTTFNCPTDL
ncbi:curli-like amyloid fiber formation chaperone CsgH [Gymnodinialimonas sp. 2305UL16-5]|uniref:curli-like amyloid fiber formation chaperone CsgH n=1 Tax=Gymnodinialimonas mytili TaxID=3126503 RepID=UPI0030985A44